MIDVLVIAWLGILLVVQPAAAFLSGRPASPSDVPRLRRYAGSAMGIGFIGVVSLGLSLAGTGDAVAAVTRPLSARVVGWSAATVLACGLFWLGTQYVRGLERRPPDELYLHMLPRTTPEKLAFAGVAVLAGTAEELAFRGVGLFQLQRLTGSMALAAVLTTAGFGLGHAYQGARGVVRTTLIGVILVIPVLATRSLIPSMVGHFTMDVVTGLWGYDLLRSQGLVPGS